LWKSGSFAANQEGHHPNIISKLHAVGHSRWKTDKQPSWKRRNEGGGSAILTRQVLPDSAELVAESTARMIDDIDAGKRRAHFIR
jgi:hypothetical protein